MVNGTHDNFNWGPLGPLSFLDRCKSLISYNQDNECYFVLCCNVNNIANPEVGL